MKKLERYKVEFLNSLNPKTEVCYSQEVEKLERRIEILESAIHAHKNALYEYTSTPDKTPDFDLYKAIE